MASARDPGLRGTINRLRKDADDVANANDAGMPEEASGAIERLLEGLEDLERRVSVAPGPVLEGELAVVKDAEERVLAGMLAGAGAEGGNQAVRDVRPLLGEDGSRFYMIQHRQIYEAIMKADANGGADVLTVSEHLRKDGVLSDIGGKERLDELFDLAPAPIQVPGFARIVRRHALERGLAGAIAAQPRDPHLIESAAAELARDNIAGDTRTAMDATDWLAKQSEGCPAVWGKGETVLWAEGEPLMIYGPDGVGKTTLAQQVVLGLCGIRTDGLLKLPVVKADRPVLYLAMDRPIQARRSFNRMIPRENREELRGRMVVWEGPLPFSVQSERALYDFCVLNGCGYVVVDSLKDYVIEPAKPEMAARAVRQFQWLLANGIDLLTLHHPRKDPAGLPAKPKTLEDVYGDRNLVGVMGSVLLLWGKAGDPVVELHHLKQPAHEFGPVKILHDHDIGLTELYNYKTIIEILASGFGPLTVTQVAAEVYQTTEVGDSDKEKIRRQLNKLVKDGEVEVLTDSHTGTKAYAARTAREARE